MIYTYGQTNNAEWLEGVPVDRLLESDIRWYWVDFECSSPEEIKRLSDPFHFNPLAIEDCVERLERPKVDFYETYNFFVLHALNPNTSEPIELDLFVGENFIVSFHLTELSEINCIRQKVSESNQAQEAGCKYIAYLIFDKVVDQYFPSVYRIEDTLNDIDNQLNDKKSYDLVDEVFEIRSNLLLLRHTVNSMKELLYRIIYSERLESFRTNKRYFNDIYDHLLTLSDTIELNRELTSDIRDNYLSINSHRMNKIMTTLTIISSIFIPLTFIVGIYGMNFDYMPELHWRYGYFIILGVMAVILIAMVLWFIKKGWFSNKK